MKFSKKYINSLIKEIDTNPVTIALDWLSFYFTHAMFFNEQVSEGDTKIINDKCYLLWIDRPTLHFNKHLVIIYNNTECGRILYASRNEKFFKSDVCKVEFINHSLYSGVWIEVYNLLIEQGLVYKAASRIDIAIDGVGYLKKLMNVYAKQTKEKQIIRLKNSSQTRARFSAKVLNPSSMEFEGFHIGTGTGNKMITIYNKSLEIIKSGKTYIQEYWKANGLIEELQDFSEFEKQIEEIEDRGYDVVNLDQLRATAHNDNDIYRFELRMKSEAIKEIQNFTPEMLMAKGGLASIVKLHCKNYFELTWCNDSNQTRCKGIEVLPYKRLEAIPITKIARVEKDGLYKAKMTIHGIVSDIYNGGIQKKNFNESVEMVIDRVERYQLNDYLDRKLIEWGNKYAPAVDEKRLNDVIIVLSEIKHRNGQLKDSIKDLSDRHRQAGATAWFGDD